MSEKEETEFEDQKTNPGTIAEAVLQHIGDGVPEPLADDVPTAPIRFGASLGEPPALPKSEDDDLSDFDDVPTVNMSLEGV